MITKLFKFGPIQFEVFPFNADELDHATASDWSRKEIAGASNYREWVGEGDEEISLRGKVFPHYMGRQMGKGTWGGGLSHLEIIDAMRRLGQAHQLIRGDGWVFGWYIIETFSRSHTALGLEGVGQQIKFEAKFQRVPVPSATGYVANLFGGAFRGR